MKHQMNDLKKQDYAVIYGATNKGGTTFAVYLARKGYNIILIDTEKDKLEKAYVTIKESLHENEFKALEIIKMNTDTFEEISFLNTVKNIETKGRIKFFINAKNVRLARKSQKKFEMINHQEIYQIILENVENFSSVFNIFAKSMMKVENAGFINISNNKNDDENELINYDILYYSSLRFIHSFVRAFRKTHP